MGCVFSHSEHTAVKENSTNRFKVKLVDRDNDDRDASNYAVPVRSGTMEVGSNELILHQKHSDPVVWSFRCLRKYGFSTDIFLFESGRRCATGPAIFAFRCARADELNNTFQEHLRQARSGRRPLSNGLLSRNITRYSEGGQRNGTTDLEPYLTPISVRNGGGNEHNYVNGQALPVAAPATHSTASNYVNTNSVTSTASQSDVNVQMPIREINYAELDLPTQPPLDGCFKKAYPNLKDLQYVDINYQCNSSSDGETDDDAFLPPTPKEKVNPSDGENAYYNVVAGAPQKAAGMRRIQYAETSNGSAHSSYESRKSQQTVPPTNGAEYIKIDFQKTAALSSSGKTAVIADGSQEGIRKTRHDSSADQLDPR